MNPRRTCVPALAVLALAACLSALPALQARAAEASGPIVLTGIQATYSLTVALTAGTPIKVENIPADGRQLSLQKDYISRRAEALASKFTAATAVVTMTNALPGDPLYRFARNANVRIVDIEAGLPWSLDAPGVALADSPVSNAAWGKDADAVESATAPYFWLSVSNAIRMSDNIAADLKALFPESAPIISKNLDGLKRSLLKLRGDYQDRLIEAGDVVYALTGDFVYLTNDMGLLVDGYFIKQDVRWTKADLAGLTKHLRDAHIKVVLHKWMPSDAIQKAISDGGAKLVVLDAGDPGVAVNGTLPADGLQQLLHKNLEAVLVALKAP
ncbi:MAG TPA: zinc ABC transporter substrate-binding protein [Steroidobacteraceae bacterium]|nr:zinc ABC transporter substrate-binding protein [Steroidobacteraceae bacterium]